MAKAVKSPTTKQISLRDAKRLVVDAYGSGQLAEKKLVQWLGEGKVRWSCKLLERGSAPKAAVWDSVVLLPPADAYSEGDAAFWLNAVKVDWDENSARQRYVTGGTAVYGVTVPRGDVVAQLPSQLPSNTSARRIALEARRMKAAGQVPSTKTAFANELAKRMRAAAATDSSISPLKASYIRNKLQEWGLWPASLIK